MNPSENANLTVLVVDDDEPSLYSSRRVIQQAGYDTLEARTGEEALVIALQERPDLIILDVRLPDISGWEVCKRLKADPATSVIPIVHLSSTYVDSASIAAGLEGGADAYLTQPVDSLVMVATVRALLRARRAEEALRRANERLEMAQRAAGAGVWDWDIVTGRLEWSPELFRLFGLDPAHASVSFATWESAMHPEDREGARARIDDVLRMHAPLVSEYRVVLPDGAIRWINALGEGTYDHLDRPVRMAGICIDVTERKQAEERILAAERARTELARTLSREISHRVKNNLAMTAGLLQMQITGEPDPHVVDVLQDTISRLFMFAEVHSQIEATSVEEIELLGLLRRLTDRIQGALRKHNVAISVDGDEVIYPGRTGANLCIIANELMTNAVKHGAPGPDGQLSVRAQLALRDGRLQFTVWNSGNPIAPDLDPNRQRSMGISLVQSLVVGQYGGAFTLEPQDGGTLARVEISDERLRAG